MGHYILKDENRKLYFEGKRRCTKCMQIKPLENYHKNGKYHDGRIRYQSRCALCRKVTGK